MTQVIGAFGFIFFLIAIIKLLKERADSKDRKKIILGGGFLLLGCLVMLFSTDELTEKEYLQEIAQITVDSDDKIKQTDAYSDADINETVEFLDEEIKKVDSLDPPESLPQEIKDSQDTLHEGMEKIKIGIRDSDSEELQNGQTIVAMAQILYSDYIDKNPDLFEE
ncbi:hypothetical protein LQF67_05585 [Tetragenococcus halophilus]|uniref:hypothetical protein n=1 Tax=Tetragenococcus halophilus TaxID=51669 RepID=UPI001F2F74DA|nr:hypothetical protein [Tetragenococcus halophilus]MCF1685057.1 hypothetical protein [Tetragenococcus halophilus]